MGKYTFYNHLGSSVIDYVLIDKTNMDIIESILVCDFNQWSDHAPIELILKCTPLTNFCRGGMVTDSDENDCITRYKWNDDLIHEMKECIELRAGELNAIVDMIGSSGIDQGVQNFTDILNYIF